MAKEYFEKLSHLIDALNLDAEIKLPVEVKHFFSGAALYVDGAICVTWSPVGLAFKLLEDEVDQLINSGRAKPLKYFPGGHVKKGYALFEAPDLSEREQWKKLFIQAAQKSQ